MNNLLLLTDVLLPAFVAGLLVIATHIPLGFKVLSRGIIFMDLAIAQVAGLGALLVTVLIGEAAHQAERFGRAELVHEPERRLHVEREFDRHVEVGEVIPGPLFTAVAQVLAYVYQLNQSLNPVLPSDWQVPAKLDPASRLEAT